MLVETIIFCRACDVKEEWDKNTDSWVSTNMHFTLEACDFSVSWKQKKKLHGKKALQAREKRERGCRSLQSEGIMAIVVDGSFGLLALHSIV